MEAENQVGGQSMISIREFEMERDAHNAQELERNCEVGPLALFTDLLGDPLCRIRHSPHFLMLVAEYGPAREMVGLIRVSLKSLVRGTNTDTDTLEPKHALTAYILGLRVSSQHRRKGIGRRLVEEAENWGREKGAEYVYMATEKDNEACINLFVEKMRFCKFRTPAILVHPVHQHCKRIPSSVCIQKLSIQEASALYKSYFSDVEFFPSDIDSVLSNPLNIGTFMVVSNSENEKNKSWAMASVWNSSEVYKMRVNGVGFAIRACASVSRKLDRALPWLQIPSFPNIFRNFGMFFVYGVHAEGAMAKEMVRCLWSFIHNMGRNHSRRSTDGCAFIATEVGACDPLKDFIPHWERFSCSEDLWCIKKLGLSPNENADSQDWTQCPPASSLFVDPRDF